jgi:hypothetical protein
VDGGEEVQVEAVLMSTGSISISSSVNKAMPLVWSPATGYVAGKYAPKGKPTGVPAKTGEPAPTPLDLLKKKWAEADLPANFPHDLIKVGPKNAEGEYPVTYLSPTLKNMAGTPFADAEGKPKAPGWAYLSVGDVVDPNGDVIWSKGKGFQGIDVGGGAADLLKQLFPDPKPAPAPAPAPKTPVGKVSTQPTPPSASPLIKQLAGKLPDIEDLTFKGDGAYLGGAGKKSIFEDPKTGAKFIFKPAIPKSGSKTQVHRAHAQEAFAAIATQVRPDHIPIKTVKYKGKLGTLQPIIELDANQPHLKKGGTPEQLTPEQQMDVGTEHLLDWLMSQHDSHRGNLLKTKEGRILSADKEQGWKYFADDKLSIDYNPNKVHGEEEPFYNTFWRAFSEGKIDFNPKVLSDALGRIEKVPAEDMEKTVAAYAQSMFPGPSQAYERYAFTRKALARKATLRADFEEFITDLYSKREGKPGKFTFKDGWVVEGEEAGPQFVEVTDTAKNLATKTLGASALKAHKTDPDLLVVRVPNMEPIDKVLEFLKSVGVEPIGDPKFGSNYNMVFVKKSELEGKTFTKMVKVEKPPGEQFANYSGAPTYMTSVTAQEAAPANVEELSSVEKDPSGPLGKRFTLDGAAVEQQTAYVQRVILPGGDEAYRVHFKLRKPYWEKIIGGSTGKYIWNRGSYNKEKDAFVMNSNEAYSQTAKLWSYPNGDELAVMKSAAAFTFKGSVYATIRSTKKGGVRKRLTQMLESIGLDKKIMRAPTANEQKKYRLAQALWAESPQTHDKMDIEAASIEDLEKKLRTTGRKLSKEDIAALREAEVMSGRQCVILPGRHKQLMYGDDPTGKNPLFLFAFWQVSSAGNVPKILTSGGIGIHERVRMGIPGSSGESASTDISTGGGDNITVRVAVRGTKHNSLNSGNVTGAIKLIISPTILDRLDIHGAASSGSGDSFGCCNPDHHGHGGQYRSRPPLNKWFKKVPNISSAEMVIRRGVAPKDIVRIATGSEKVRKSVLQALVGAGIEKFNGVPIEDFVVIETNQQAVFDKYLKPLGF